MAKYAGVENSGGNEGEPGTHSFVCGQDLLFFIDDV